MSSVRFGTDWAALDTRHELLQTDVPILLFHGTEDETIPVSQSADFAADAGERVTYIEVTGAEHVGSWNVDPDRYEMELSGWLAAVLGE